MRASIQKRIIHKLKYGEDPLVEANNIKQCLKYANKIIKAGPRKGSEGFNDIWTIEYLKAVRVSMKKRYRKLKKEFKL